MMASDTNALKILFIGDACARLTASSELASLAAHTYHRFSYKMGNKFNTLDPYAIGAACIKLAHLTYELQLPIDNLVLVAISLVHGPDRVVDDQVRRKLGETIDTYCTMICFHLDFEISFKDTRRITPGDLIQQYANQRQPLPAYMRDPAEESDDDVLGSPFLDDDFDDSDELLSKNSRELISGHRYLAHYLNIIRFHVHSSQEHMFAKISNIAWILLSDIYWSPIVLHYPTRKLACASLMMAIRLSRNDLNKQDEPNRIKLWEYLNKKWNLIFCDDFKSKQLEILINDMVKSFLQFNRLLQRDLEFDITSIMKN